MKQQQQMQMRFQFSFELVGQFGLGIALLFRMLEKFVAYQMAKRHYQICKSLRLPRFLQDQLLRASSSIALNLAEGSGKRTAEDQRRFYSIAFGSLRECQAITELEEIEDADLKEINNQLGAMLYTLSRKRLNPSCPKF